MGWVGGTLGPAICWGPHNAVTPVTALTVNIVSRSTPPTRNLVAFVCLLWQCMYLAQGMAESQSFEECEIYQRE